MPAVTPLLPLREKLAYGLGDAGANFVFQTQITFLMYFYTDVFGISASAAGTVLLVSRLVDALNDPIIGALADRSNSRWGRYRPWLLWTAVPLAVALVLCFTTPSLGMTGKIVWAFVTCNLLMFIYAANNIPYCALTGVITDDSGERTSLTTWRFLCAMATALVVNTFTLDLVRIFGQGNEVQGYPRAMAVWGLVAVACFGITFAFTRERIGTGRRTPTTLRQDLIDLFRNGPWLALFLVALLVHLQLAMRGGSMLFYFMHYLQRSDLFGPFNAVGLVVTMIGIVLSKPLAERFGKRDTFRASLLISSLLMAAFIFVPRDAIKTVFLLQILLQLAFGPSIPLLWAMMADVADFSEWKTGRRSTALAFASIVFGLKMGFGLGFWLNGVLLDYFNYSANAELSESALHGIVLLIGLLPALALLLCLVTLSFYRIDNQMERTIEMTLRQRRATLETTPSSATPPAI